jgi:hypothetical protein
LVGVCTPHKEQGAPLLDRIFGNFWRGCATLVEEKKEKKKEKEKNKNKNKKARRQGRKKRKKEKKSRGWWWRKPNYSCHRWELKLSSKPLRFEHE